MQEGLSQTKIWAIAQARVTIDLPPHEGLEVCQTQSEAAAAIYERGRYSSGQPTQIKTCEQFANVAGKAIVNWEQDDTLPAPHPDLGADVGRRTLMVVRENLRIESFNRAEYMSDAVSRLRIVRLALPEILRANKSSNSIRDQVSGIAEQLARICPPGGLRRDKPGARGGWH